MFLQTIDADERHVVFIDDHHEGKAGRWLFFASADHIGKTPMPFHYACEIDDPVTQRVMTRWFAARRDRWQRWGAIAESIGPERFGGYMKGLMATEPLEEVIAIEVSFSTDGRSISIGEKLVGVRGTRTEVMFGHRFRSQEAGRALYRWFNTGHNAERSAAFVKLGYSKGAEALGTHLDRLAANEIEGPATSGSEWGHRPASGRYN